MRSFMEFLTCCEMCCFFLCYLILVPTINSTPWPMAEQGSPWWTSWCLLDGDRFHCDPTRAHAPPYKPHLEVQRPELEKARKNHMLMPRHLHPQKGTDPLEPRQQMSFLITYSQARFNSQKSSHFLSTDFSIIFSQHCKSWLSEAAGMLIGWLYGNWVILLCSWLLQASAHAEPLVGNQTHHLQMPFTYLTHSPI